MANPFRLLTTDPSGARRGELGLKRGTVPTPTFMPVGTAAAVKGVTAAQVKETGAGIVLANTYHLALQPGSDKIAKLGGLHKFMGWGGAPAKLTPERLMEIQAQLGAGIAMVFDECLEYPCPEGRAAESIGA
jgi:queuine tRNA-ribosyltransferase